MATKSKLRQAIEKQADELSDAQKELVLSQFSTYEWNKARMRQIEDIFRMMDLHPASDLKELKAETARRKALSSERTQLSNANNSISSKLFMQLKSTGADMDEFDEFLKG